MLSVKQGRIKYHFLSFWYDLIRDWILISRAIGKHLTQLANLFYKIKQKFFNTVAMLALLYGCTSWTLMKCLEKSKNYTRILHVGFNKSWKQQLYGHLPPISQNIPVRWTRHAGYCRSKDNLMSSIIQWTPTHGQKCWLTNKNLNSLSPWGYWMLFRWLNKNDIL